jgi:hypothetical protein
MDDQPPIQAITVAGDRLPPEPGVTAAALLLSPAGQAALAAAQALAKKATAAATLRGYSQPPLRWSVPISPCAHHHTQAAVGAGQNASGQ